MEVAFHSMSLVRVGDGFLGESPKRYSQLQKGVRDQL